MTARAAKTRASKVVSQTTIEQIVLLMIAGLRHQAVVDTCVDKLSIPPDRIDGAIAEARRLITAAADYDRDAVLGEAITRLDDLYKRALLSKEVSIALSAQREKNRLLLGMVSMAPEPIHEPHADAAGDDADADKTPERRNADIESDELAAIVEAIETSLEPLALTADVHVTDAELIALAGQELLSLRNANKRPTPKKKRTKANRRATK